MELPYTLSTRKSDTARQIKKSIQTLNHHTTHHGVGNSLKLFGLGATPAVFMSLPRRAHCLSQALPAPSPTTQNERESPTEERLPKPSSDAHSGLPAKQRRVAAGPTAFPFSSPTHFLP